MTGSIPEHLNLIDIYSPRYPYLNASLLCRDIYLYYSHQCLNVIDFQAKMGTVCSKSGQGKIQHNHENVTSADEDNGVRLTYEVTPDNVIRSAPALQSCQIPEGSLGKYIWDALSRRGDRICSVCADTNWSYTNREIRSYGRRIASSLIKVGIRAGDNVCIYSGNERQLLIMVVAVLFMGGTVTICHPAHSSDELWKRLEQNNSKVLVTATECASKAKEAASKLPLLKVKHTFFFIAYT